MANRSWDVELEGRKHRVELAHAYMSGKRSVRVDGRVVYEGGSLIDFGGHHTFDVDGHPCITGGGGRDHLPVLRLLQGKGSCHAAHGCTWTESCRGVVPDCGSYTVSDCTEHPGCMLVTP